VFVDRDGVINALVTDPVSGEQESPLNPADVRLLPGAGAALKQLRDAGFLLVGVSNQPAAAKGTLTIAQLEAIQARVLELLGVEGVRFDDFRICLHHPDGIVPDLSGPCDCRKPAPGMLRDAAAALGIALERSWMIGDTDADVEAGRAAGCRTVLVEHPGSAHKRRGAVAADLTACDLDRAALAILGREAVSSTQ
jgi:D-glycero-D-manno-heptose 1,7-bisphosphate phosphatase